MTKPFQLAERLRGKIGDKLVVSTPKGNLTLTKNVNNLTEAQNRGSEGVRRVLAFSRGNFSRQEGAIRQGFRRGTAEIARALRLAPRNNGGELHASTKKSLEKQADRIVREGIQQASDKIRANIESHTRRVIRAQIRTLTGMGITPPKLKQINELVATASRNAMTRPFPGTDTNNIQRLGAIGARTRKLYQEALEAPKNELRGALDKLRRGAHDPKPGNTRVDGGSSSKAIARINRTEQARAAREAVLSLGAQLGFNFVYWRLSGLHKSYGGREICEKLTAATGPDVRGKLNRLGIDLSSVDLQGLFSLEALPNIPHPNCMCFQEMWHPPEILSSIRESSRGLRG